MGIYKKSGVPDEPDWNRRSHTLIITSELTSKAVKD